MKVCLHIKKIKLGSGGIRTYSSEGLGALNQRLRHSTRLLLTCSQFAFHQKKPLV